MDCSLCTVRVVVASAVCHAYPCHGHYSHTAGTGKSVMRRSRWQATDREFNACNCEPATPLKQKEKQPANNDRSETKTVVSQFDIRSLVLGGSRRGRIQKLPKMKFPKTSPPIVDR